MKTRADWLGANIDGKFRIISLLSEGGMGVAYLGEQEELGRKVVLKILHLNLANDPEGKARFIREAQLLGSLQHNHLVQVYSAGVYADEFPYIAMEYLEGNTLEEVLKKSGPLDWKRACRIVMQSCEAMAYCHSAGVIHRDLKPANLILLQNTQSDFVKVIDFGLAKALDGSKNTLTATGLVVGSPHYMSPEACAGQKPDARSDIYSLGCVLYEMLTGRPPFISESPFELFSAHKEEQPSEASKFAPQAAIPAALDATLLKALEKIPDNRFASMQEFSANLNAVLSDRELSFDLKELSAYRQKSKTRISPLKIGIIAAISLTLVIAGIAFSLRVRNSRNLQVAATSNATTRDSFNVEQALDDMDKAKKRGDQKRVKEQANKAIRLIIRIFSSNRDRKTTFEKELSIMDRMKKEGLTFFNADQYPHVRNSAKLHLMDSEDGGTAENFHNKAVFQTLEAKVFEGMPGHNGYAVESYSHAAISFSRAKELDNAKLVLKLSEKPLLAETQQSPKYGYFLRCYNDIGSVSTLAFQKDQQPFIAAAKELAGRFDKVGGLEEVRCLAQLGWLCEMCGQNDLAMTFFRKGIALKAPGPQWFETECIAGLALVLEEEARYQEALEWQVELGKRFTNTGLISRYAKVQHDLERLHSLASEKEGKQANQ